MDNYSFDIRWSDQDAGYIAMCPEFSGVSAFGDTAEAALREVTNALELAISTYQEQGWTLPAPRVTNEYSGQIRLRMPKSLHAALAQHAESEGLSFNTIAVKYLAESLGTVHGASQIQKRIDSLVNEIKNLAYNAGRAAPELDLSGVDSASEWGQASSWRRVCVEAKELPTEHFPDPSLRSHRQPIPLKTMNQNLALSA